MKKFTFRMIIVVLVQIIMINIAVAAIFLRAGGDELFPWIFKDKKDIKPVSVRELVYTPIKKSERLVRKLENNDIIEVMKRIFVSREESKEAFRIKE